MAAKPNAEATAAEGADTGIAMKVTTKGDGKIHKGWFIKGTNVPECFNKGDTFRAPTQEAADQLMDRGYADLP
jgi:hypothetical protein